LDALAHSEMVEQELTAFIERRSRKGEMDPNEREESWMESVRRFHERAQAERRQQWTDFHGSMAVVHGRLADEDLTPAAKAKRIRELSRDFETAYRAEKEATERAIEQHRRSLTRKAYPPEEIGNDVQRELLEELRGGRIEREIATQAETGGFNPVEALKDARYRGDTARQAAIERVGKRYLPKDPALRSEFDRLVEEGMSPQRREAMRELEAFERQALEVGQAVALADRTTRQTLGALSRMPTNEDHRGLASSAQGSR
jgi:hypothetical protein